MVREGEASGKPPNGTDFIKEFGVSRRTVARDLDFLRDEERAPREYDAARRARKLLGHYEATPLEGHIINPAKTASQKRGM
jgi:DeoR/GlpR family transcriptional regulator of sugar metabolism